MDIIMNQLYQMRSEMEKISVRGNDSIMAMATCFLLCGDIIEKLQKEREGIVSNGQGNCETPG